MPITMKAISTEKATRNLDHQRHALGAGRRQHQAVLQRHEADHLAHGIAPRHHHQQAEQHHRQRKRKILARQRIGLRRHPQHHHHRQRHQPHAEQHGRTDADHGLDLAVDAELDDDPVQNDRNDDGLEDQRDAGGDVEMRRVLDERLPGDRRRQHQSVQRVDVEQRVEPVLIELHEAHQHQRAGEHVSDIEREAVHGAHRLPDTNSSRMASRPSISAAPRYCGTRNTRILAMAVSKTASSTPPVASLPI